MKTPSLPYGRMALCLLTCVAGVIAIVHGAFADAFPLWGGAPPLTGL